MCIAALSMKKLSAAHLVTKCLAFLIPKDSSRCSIFAEALNQS